MATGGLALSLVVVSAAAGQENPVYVDDSPRAWELFRLAGQQAEDNLGEAVRLYQELLDDYALKLLPVNESSADHFVAVRERVLAELKSNEQLLERYRSIETPLARRLLESERPARVAMTRPWTEPGLEALLRLGQEDLESARFHACLGRLSEAAGHPDLTGSRAAHCWLMIGLAAHYIGDTHRLSLARAQLEDLGTVASELSGQLDRLVSQSTAPPSRRGTWLLNRARVAELNELVAQPIWSVALKGTASSRRLGDPALADERAGRPVQQMRRSGSLLTAAATVTESAVYVNDGRTIRAVDRFTGRPLWPPYVDRPDPAASDKVLRQVADLNFVAVREPLLITLTGHAYADTTASERTVVCLDTSTGRLRWAVRIDRLEGPDELEGLVPHGAPVIGEQMVFVAARKVSKQLLTSSYVVALDLTDGRLRWARHVASSGGIRTRVARPFSTIVYHHGDVVFATAIGAIARIDATTGQTRWLRRYNPPLSPLLPQERSPWEISGAVVTSRGVIALRPDHERVLVLDWVRGDETDSISATGRDAWNAPKYLLADGDFIYAIGSQIRAFRLDQLDRPLWRFPAPDAAGEERVSYEADRLEIRGRVQLAERALVVPTTEGLFVVDGATGDVQHHLGLPMAGNPLAAGPQLILAGSDTLAAYMPFDRAEQMLRQQIAAAPANPGPALALMRLGVQVGDLSLALGVAEQVIGALDVAPTDPALRHARQELFEILLEIDRRNLAATIEQGEALHALIGVVASDPRQRVEQLLAYGDWLSGRALARAVEAYQTILSTPVLADAARNKAGSVRSGASWSADRLAVLVARHGAGVYQPQADFARRRLDLLKKDTVVLPGRFVALAGEFPFAEPAVEAAAIAARRYAAEGDLRRAAAALTTLYRLAPGKERAVSLLGELGSLLIEGGWDEHAWTVERFVFETYGELNVTRLLKRPRGPERPAVIPIGTKAQRLPGTLLPLGSGVRSVPSDRVLLKDGSRISLVSGAQLRPLWTVDLDVVGMTSVLRFDADGLLLWVASPGDGPRALMLDPQKNGEQRWISPTFAELAGALPRPRPPRAGVRLEQGPGFDPKETIPLVGRTALVMVRRSGEVLALDLTDGKTILWHRRQPLLEIVHLAQIHDVGLVLGGFLKPRDRNELVPALIMLDPVTGRTIQEIAPLGSGVKWMTIGPLGALVYGTDEAIESIDLLSGRKLWSNVSSAGRQTKRGWLAGGHLVVETPTARPAERRNPLRAVRMVDGSISNAFDLPADGQFNRMGPKEVLIDKGRIFALYGRRVVRFHTSGAVLGADMISDQHDFRWLFATGDRLLVVSRFKSEPVIVPGQAGRRHQHTYRLYALSENCKLLGEAFQLPPLAASLQRAAVIEGWLLLSTTKSTIAVPLPTDS